MQEKEVVAAPDNTVVKAKKGRKKAYHGGRRIKEDVTNELRYLRRQIAEEVLRDLFTVQDPQWLSVQQLLKLLGERLATSH